MESSPHSNFSQTPSQEHILRPEEEKEPVVYEGNIKTGEPLPRFDYDVALAMTKGGDTPSQESPLPLEQQVSLEQKIKVFPRERVLRAGDRFKKYAAITATAVAGLAAAGNASAGGIQGMDRVGQAIGDNLKNAVLGAIGAPVVVGRDQQGNSAIRMKTPQEMAVTTQLQTSPEVLQYAKAIGVGFINSGNIFTVLNEGNPGQCVTIPKYTNDTQYVTNLRLTMAEGGGLLLHVHYVQGVSGNRLIPKSQIVTIRTNENRQMACTIIGG